MCSIKLIVLFAVVACVYSEPPRRKSNFRTFSRQEAAEGAAADPPASQGYKYKPPAGERLRLPLEFARQETSSPAGYSYPKPTNGYGPPEEENETTDDPSDGTTAYPDSESVTENSQAETLRNLQATQFRRKNAKITRTRNEAQQVEQDIQFPQQVQPVFYVQYPSAELVQPQYVYVFK